ncbi:hypothetical protein NLJ89_g6073 [Agrocybe chaxingu]|uniref:DUF6699 domain-containing protein n=1 Tax=Agrocybe chaxingu TaxID=84603 RepID=A0A9W8JZH7_9AGAR|nr:hypothetical protein NLJ89_g6073 [Agrocybe chaxingu]
MSDVTDASRVNRVHFIPVDILTSLSGQDVSRDSHAAPATPQASPPLRLFSTPSPTNSLSTVSTSGPLTPPPNSVSDPNSPTSVPGIAIHRSLAAPTMIPWDVTRDPSDEGTIPDLKNIGDKAAICNNGHPLKTIRIRLPAIGVAVDVHGARNRVTIRDVLRGIYAELQNAPRDDIWSSLPKDFKDAVNRTHKQRSPERDDWLRYIDFLGHNVNFQGLRPIEGNSKEWDVLFGPATRS